MKRLFAQLGVVAALAATFMTTQSALAASPRVAKTTVPSSHVRSLPARVPQHVVSTTGGGRRIAQSSAMSPFGSSGLSPRLSQMPSRNRTLPPSVAPITPPAPYPTPAPTPTPPDTYHISAQQILINQDRASNGGLAGLAWSPCLADIAQQNAQRIAAQGYLSHTNGPTLDLGCDPSYRTAGENIAYITSGIDDAQANTMFMNSAPHRANILNGSYRFVGTAWVVAPNGYGYIAVEFAG